MRLPDSPEARGPCLTPPASLGTPLAMSTSSSAALILASASPRRRELLERAAVAFEVRPANILERREPGEPPALFARRLALAKARTVARKAGASPPRLVLGADTIVVVGERVLGKPRDEAEALEMLRALAGREHSVLTGVCVVNAATGSVASRVVATRVRFHAASDEELRRYVASGEPLGRAGAYAIQGYGGLLVAGIDGDYSNVVGLPLGATLDLLAEALPGER